MLSFLQYIIWDVSPEIFDTKYFSVRWYGLLFALGFLIGQQILIHIFKKEGKPESDVEVLTVYMVLSTIIGARLGHCLFYEPEHYLANPIEILKVWEGGLASHGATIGILFALWLYARKKKDQSYLWVVDRIVVTVALAGCLIRLGNLMNSEIIGKPANVPWAFVFARSAEEELLATHGNYIETIDAQPAAPADTLINSDYYTGVNLAVGFKKGSVDEATAKTLAQSTFPTILRQASQGRGETSKHIFTPPVVDASSQAAKGQFTANVKVFGLTRHPAQLYESLSCLVLFGFLLWLWNRRKAKTPEGSLLGIFLIYIFGLRFVYEFLKENQVGFEDDLALNMGQWLSIPAVLGGIFVLLIANRNAKKRDARDVAGEAVGSKTSAVSNRR